MTSGSPLATNAPQLIKGINHRKGNALDWTELFPAETVDVRGALSDISAQPNVPDTAGELDRRRHAPDTYASIPVDLIRLHDAWLETSMCVAITSTHHYIPNTMRTARQAKEVGYVQQDAMEFRLPGAESLADHEGPALLLGLPVGRNYFHWLLEAIPRWLFAEAHIDSEVSLVVPPLGPMEQSTLDASGVDSRRLLQVAPQSLIHVSELIVTPRGLRGSHELLPAAVRRLHELAPSSGGDERLRLFISRANAGRRRIDNESDVLEVLSKHGFQAIHPDTLSVQDQIALFSKAEAIIGYHGAGLANAVFANQDCTIVELQQPGLDDARMMLYWHQVAAMGQNYNQLICSAAPQQTGSTSESDIAIDPTHLDQHLSMIL